VVHIPYPVSDKSSAKSNPDYVGNASAHSRELKLGQLRDFRLIGIAAVNLRGQDFLDAAIHIHSFQSELV
jgi:hypothetical protein